MAISFTLTGVDELKNKINNLQGALKTDVAHELNASALAIQNSAKRKAPVNFGTLRNQILLTKDNDLSYTVVANASYSAYVEFGTGGKVSVPSTYQEYASTFKGKKGGKFAEMIQALMLWAKRKGLTNGKNDKSVAFLIARSILKNGMRAQPFLIPAFEEEKPKLIERINKILNAKS